MNYCCFIVKIITPPIQTYFEDEISLVEIVTKFSSIRKKKTVEVFRLSVWGNLANDIIKYYHVNDYIIIEGYISYNCNLFEPFQNNQIEISVRKIYPFFLNNRLNIIS